MSGTLLGGGVALIAVSIVTMDLVWLVAGLLCVALSFVTEEE